MAEVRLKNLNVDFGSLPDQTATVFIWGRQFIGHTSIEKEIRTMMRLKKIDRDYLVAESKEDLQKMHSLLNEKMELLGLKPPPEDYNSEDF